MHTFPQIHFLRHALPLCNQYIYMIQCNVTLPELGWQPRDASQIYARSFAVLVELACWAFGKRKRWYSLLSASRNTSTFWPFRQRVIVESLSVLVARYFTACTNNTQTFYLDWSIHRTWIGLSFNGGNKPSLELHCTIVLRRRVRFGSKRTDSYTWTKLVLWFSSNVAFVFFPCILWPELVVFLVNVWNLGYSWKCMDIFF